MKTKNLNEISELLTSLRELEWLPEWFDCKKPNFNSTYHEWRVKPRPDYTEELTLFWNPCVGLTKGIDKYSQYLTDSRNYKIYGNFKITIDGENGEDGMVSAYINKGITGHGSHG